MGFTGKNPAASKIFPAISPSPTVVSYSGRDIETESIFFPLKLISDIISPVSQCMICLTRRASPLFLIPLMPPSKYVSFSIRLRSWTKPFLCRPSLTSFRSPTGIFISTSIISRVPPPFRRAPGRQAESMPLRVCRQTQYSFLLLRIIKRQDPLPRFLP